MSDAERKARIEELERFSEQASRWMMCKADSPAEVIEFARRAMARRISELKQKGARATGMRDWSKEFNDLPFEVREVCSAVVMDTQIRELRRLKDFMQRAHKYQMEALNGRIRLIEKSISDFEQEK